MMNLSLSQELVVEPEVVDHGVVTTVVVMVATMVLAVEEVQ